MVKLVFRIQEWQTFALMLTKPNLRGASNVTWAPNATIFLRSRLQWKGGDISRWRDHRVSSARHWCGLGVWGYDQTPPGYFVEWTRGRYLKYFILYKEYNFFVLHVIDWRATLWKRPQQNDYEFQSKGIVISDTWMESKVPKRGEPIDLKMSCTVFPYLTGSNFGFSQWLIKKCLNVLIKNIVLN